MRTRGQALGQNFLHHKPTIAKILDQVEKEILETPRKSGVLVEVGPGKLALTTGLDELATKHNLAFELVERDHQLEDGIRAALPGRKLHMMDAASDEFGALLAALSDAGRRHVFVASNLPYSAASQIIAKLCHGSGSGAVSGAVVMVQKEMADRMCAPPGGHDRGSFSLLVQSYFEAARCFEVGAGAFSPPPKVTSSVIRLRPLARAVTADLARPLDFERFCKHLFSQRRKMIRKLIPAEKHQLFPKLGISGTERPEVLSLEIVLELYRNSIGG